MLDDQICIGVGLLHQGQFFLKQVDSYDVVDSVWEGKDGIEPLDVVLDNGDHCEVT